MDQFPPIDCYGGYNYISEIPDECLMLIFRFLSSDDRRNCSLVCWRWLRVEGQSLRHLNIDLEAKTDVIHHIRAIFWRFDSISHLTLRCINDEALLQISMCCTNLEQLGLIHCREVTNVGMAALAQNCKRLKAFFCNSCTFGAKGMNALLNNCSSLEELWVLKDILAAEAIGPGAVASSLKLIFLKDVSDVMRFAPLIIGSKNLKRFRVLSSKGDIDSLLQSIAGRQNCILEVDLYMLEVTDVGLRALSNYSKLLALSLHGTDECKAEGFAAMVKSCKELRILHFEARWEGDDCLLAIAKNCANLKELAILGLNPTATGMSAVATHCRQLQTLYLVGSQSIAGRQNCILEVDLYMLELPLFFREFAGFGEFFEEFAAMSILQGQVNPVVVMKPAVEP